MTDQSIQKANRNAALRWGGFVVGLLSLQVAGGAYAIYLATGDPSVAVVPDYHQKALDWDKEIQLRHDSKQLNWELQLTATDDRALVVQLKDQGGRYIAVQSGTLQLYHHSRAGEVIRLPLQSTSGEAIVFPGCFPRPGIWQIDFDLTDQAGNRFVDSRTVTVGADTNTKNGEAK